MTRRGHVVAYGMLAVLLAGIISALLSFAPTPGVAVPEGSGSGSRVVVEPGDTLWSLAERHDPTRHPAATVEEIRRVNQLRGYTVHPGQTLLMP